MHHFRQCFHWQQVEYAPDDFNLHFCLRSQRGSLGGFHDSAPDILQNCAVFVAAVIIDLRKIGYYIWSLAPFGNHVMHPRIRRNMFAHHVHHVIHRLHPVQSRTAPVGCGRGMGRLTAKPDFGRNVSQRSRGVGTVTVGGMPVQHRIHIVEQTRPHHIYLARTALFGGGAIQFDGAFLPRFLHPFFHRYRCRHRPRPEQMVSTGMARPLALNGFSLRHRILIYTGQGIIFGQNAQHRFAATEGGHKSGRNVGYAGRYGEPLLAEVFLQQSRTFGFLVAHFGPVPNLFGYRAIAGCLCV